MTLPEAVSGWIREAEACGATALHLIPGCLPRVRVGRELLPMETAAPGDLESTGRPEGPLAAEEIEALVGTFFSGGLMPTVRQRGQGEAFVETTDGRRLRATACRAQKQWQVVFQLDIPVPGSQPRSSLHART